MEKLKIIIILFVVLFSVNNCTELKDWSDPTDNIPPGMVTNPEVENIPGGAIITYTLPDDKDLLGVKALYSYNDYDKQQLAVFSSAYTDIIKLVGFPNTDERTVQLIAIDKSKNESEPLNVQIKPLTPPVDLIRQSLNVASTFGGLYVTWDNIAEADIGVYLSYKDSTGFFIHDYTYFSNGVDGKYSFRGYDNTSKEFQIVIRDRWNNYSEPFDTIITPLFEEKLNPFDNRGILQWIQYGFDTREVLWRGDTPKTSRPWIDAFDGDPSTYWNSGPPGNILEDFIGGTGQTPLVPIYFTIDLQRKVYISRHHLWHRSARPYAGNNIKKYEIWATNQKPKGGPEDFETQEESLAYWTSWPEVGGTDQWKENWTKIADCETIPPSGATNVLEITKEDEAWEKAHGSEFDIYLEYTSVPFRYLRIVSQKNWQESTILHIGEFQFYGSYVD